MYSEGFRNTVTHFAKTVEALSGVRCFACFVHAEEKGGFAYQKENEFVVAKALPAALKALVEPEEETVTFRFFFNPSEELVTADAEEFFKEAGQGKNNHELFLLPYLPKGERLASEPFLKTKYGAEARFVQHVGKTEIHASLHNINLTQSEEATLRHAIDESLKEPKESGTGQVYQKEHVNKAVINKSIDESILLSGLNKVKKHLYDGECYLLNFTCRIANCAAPSDFSLLKFLYNWFARRSRFGIFFDLRGIGVLSFSPERFVATRDGWILTEPIKGTARIQESESAAAATLELWESQKEMCEQSLVVDLLRHDLNGVCEPSTVAVYKPFFIRATRHLLQMQSFVYGRLSQPLMLIRALKSLLPAGSVTGTPKQRVCEIIRETEKVPRGYYTGVFGLCSGNELESVLLIRSFFKGRLGIYAGVGAGVTTLSDPKKEIEEFHSKLQSFWLR